MVEDRTRSDLFRDVLLQLEIAAETGNEDVECHIREVLVPFIQKEETFSQMAEEA